jgi:hypothetical protein
VNLRNQHLAASDHAAPVDIGRELGLGIRYGIKTCDQKITMSAARSRRRHHVIGFGVHVVPQTMIQPFR